MQPKWPQRGRPPPEDGSDAIDAKAAMASGYLADHGARIFNRIVDTALRDHHLSLAPIGPLLRLS